MDAGDGAKAESCWVDSSGVGALLRVFRVSLQPGKLVLALAGLALTLGIGTLLDGVWGMADRAIPADAIIDYVAGLPVIDADAEATSGVFAVFAGFELACVRDAIESVRYGRLLGAIRAGEPVAAAPFGGGDHAVRGALANLLLMGAGAVWLITRHYFYALLLIPSTLLIWSVCGGAICRMCAVESARDERITVKEAVAFARGKLFDGFFTAPLLPLAFCLLLAALLMLGGAVLSIPWLGDLLAGLLFGLALLGGLAMALVLIGLAAGGSLMWPTIAVEGSDAFDAASRSVSYVFGRPLRAIWYAVWLVVLGSAGWLMVMFATWLTAAATYLFVGLGSGLATREGAANKLSALWATPTFERLHALPDGVLGWDWVSAGLIGFWVLLLWGLAWSYLVSFYFSGSTAAYFLLRRDVDGTDPSDVRIESEETETAEAA